MKYLYIYLIIINIIGFFAMAIDKSKARRGAWRIPEKTLFLLSFIGGSLGTLTGMYVFRHKTKHMKFVWGMPAIFILHVVGLAGLVYWVYFMC